MPTEDIVFKSLGKSAGKIRKVELLGSKQKLSWSQDIESLTVEKPNAFPNDIALVFKITIK
jgi:alpha-L-fucosidase